MAAATHNYISSLSYRLSRNFAASMTFFAAVCMILAVMADSFGLLSANTMKENQASQSIRLCMAGIQAAEIACPKLREIASSVKEPDTSVSKKAVCRPTPGKKAVIPKKAKKPRQPLPVNESASQNAYDQSLVSTSDGSAKNASDNALPDADDSGAKGEIDRKPADTQETSPFAIADSLASLLDREKYYPVPAVRSGFEGKVTFIVRIGTDGTILDYRIIKVEACDLLVDAAEKTMKKAVGMAGQFGSCPKETEIEVPVIFSLR